MELTLLGTGDAGGIPRYGCFCAKCEQARVEPRLRRSATSASIKVENNLYLIDAGLMNIEERFSSKSLKGIFLTHYHPDHVQGLFHIRWGVGDLLPVYAPPDKLGCADLFKNPGILKFIPQKKYQTLRLGELNITALPMIHSKLTYGYLFEYKKTFFAYLTDTKGLPEKVIEYLSDVSLDCLIIDASASPEEVNNNHNTITEAIDISNSLNPQKTVLTHIGHECDAWLDENQKTLPKNVSIAFDGMVISK